MREKRFHSRARNHFVALVVLLSLASTSGLFYWSGLASASTSLPKYIDEYEIPTSDSAPLAIAVDKNGMIWFTESNVSKIGQFDPKSSTFHEYSVPGVGDMWGVIVDRNDTVWFTQYSGKGSVNPGGMVMGGGQGRLVRFDPVHGGFTFVNIPTVGSFPIRLVADARNRIWFTELLGNKIGVYDPSSERLTEYIVPTNSSGPADLTIDKSGAIWFTETYAKKVAKFNPRNLTFVEYPLDLQNPARIVFSPVGIAVAEDGSVWLADHGGNWIAKFEPLSGDVIKYPTHMPPAEVYPISIPNGLLIDNQGQVWFCEHGGNSIGYYAPNARMMVEFRIPTGPVSTALWMALAPGGDIWFTEWSANKIGVVHADLPVSVSLNLPENYLKLHAGEKRTLSFTVSSSQPTMGNGTLRYSWSSYNPRDISIGFTPAYPHLDADTQAQAQLALSNRLSPGNYTLGLEADLGDVIVSSMVETAVTSPQLPAPSPVPSQFVLLLAIISFLAAIAAIAARRIRRSS